MQVIDRVQTDRTQNGVILNKALRLLKANIPLYPPSAEALRELDQFLTNLSQLHDDNASMLKVAIARIR